jgi:hypothetical protein
MTRRFSSSGNGQIAVGGSVPLLALVLVVILLGSVVGHGSMTDRERISLALSAGGNAPSVTAAGNAPSVTAAGNAPTGLSAQTTTAEEEPPSHPAATKAPADRQFTILRDDGCGGTGGLAVPRKFESGMGVDLGGYTVRLPLVFVDDGEVVGFRFVSTEPLGSIMVEADGGVHSSGPVVVGRYAHGRHVGTVWFPGAAKDDDVPGIHEVRLTTCLPPSSGPTTPRATPSETPVDDTPVGDSRRDPPQGPPPERPNPPVPDPPVPTPTETPAATPTETPEQTSTETPEPTLTDTSEPTPTETPEPTTVETPEPAPTETSEPTPTEDA